MKNVLLIILSAAMVLVLGSCGNNNGQPGNTAVVPNACGAGVPAGYCNSYNPSAYPTVPASYGTYGYGTYGTGYIPGAYGSSCPLGYTPVYTGISYSCAAVSGVYGYGGYLRARPRK